MVRDHQPGILDGIFRYRHDCRIGTAARPVGSRDNGSLTLRRHGVTLVMDCAASAPAYLLCHSKCRHAKGTSL
jgi:hypothetical protein